VACVFDSYRRGGGGEKLFAGVGLLLLLNSVWFYSVIAFFKKGKSFASLSLSRILVVKRK